MPPLEKQTFDERHVDYWLKVYEQTGLSTFGVALEVFLDDPYYYLRRLGSGDLAAGIDLLTLMSPMGTA